MITLPQSQFRKAARFASSVVERRNTIPALGALKFVANGRLSIEGTDLDTYARAVLPYDGEEAEFLLANPRRVLDAIKVAGSESVSFEKDDDGLRMTAGELAADFGYTMHPDDFPTDNGIAEEVFGATVGSEFFRALNRVRPAVSTEETRYYLNGIFAHKIGDWLYRLAATDGHRLFIADVPLPDATGELPDVIIPRRTIERVIAAFAKSRDGVRFAVGRSALSNQKDKTLAPNGAASRVGFSGENDGIGMTLTSKLIDGKYPDYARVIPTEHSFTIRLNRAALVKAVKSLTPLSYNRTRAIRITTEAGRVLIELNSPELGKSRHPVAAEHKAPKDFYVGLNAQYLLDALGSLDGGEVEFGLTDAGAPMTITDPADTAFKVVLMPMRV